MRLLTFLSRRPIVVATALLLLPVPAWATDSPVDRATLRGVDSVMVTVEEMKPDAERDGLRTTQIQTDVELRLRQSGIKVDSSSRCLLYVNVDTLKLDTGLYSFNIEVEFNQEVMLLRDPTITNLAPTWSVTMIGHAGADKLRNVRSFVIDLVERFIDAYREQNPKQ